MKTKAYSIKLLVVTGLFFVFGFTAKAENSENVRLVMLQNKKVFLEANNPRNQPISIKIVNNSTEENLYSEELTSDLLYKKYYNLSNLPEGNYTISVKIDNQVFVKEIQLNNTTPLLLSETSYYEPVFEDRNSDLVIKFVNADQENVLVSFWKGSESFFEDEPGNLSAFSRKYNLKNLERGEYSVELLSGGKNYSYNFYIR